MNIISAIINLVNNPITHLVRQYKGRNRVNDVGSALEEYVKDLFAGTFDMVEEKRLERFNVVFSYLGNNANPPDAMLRGGDAIEVKKIEKNAELALNSSYPKHTIQSSSSMITKACRSAENWEEKDIIYVVGEIQNDNLNHLCMVYGLDYCASDECYSRIKSTIKTGVESIPNVEFAETKELGRINKIDPLGITYLRVRGMWGIENPWNVFNYVVTHNMIKDFNFMCIINDTKWATFENTGELLALSERIPALLVTNIRVKNPDNPAQLNNAKLISFSA